MPIEAVDAAPMADRLPAAGPRHPIEATPQEGKGPLPPPDQADEYLRNALTGLMGRKAVWSFFKAENFAQNVVATVDNLGRDTASSHTWPVSRTEGRFAIEGEADAMTISAANARRYTPFVDQVAAVDTKKVVALYIHLYPWLQRAYESLGYPDAYFNDRVVEVIDLLLTTPRALAPMKVKRPGDGVVGGSTSGPVLYQFADPDLEALSAGQKILLRIGPENADALRAKLAEFKGHIARGRTARALSR